MALAAQAAYLRIGPDRLMVNTFETSEAELDLGGQRVSVDARSDFPHRGRSLITLSMTNSATFGIATRRRMGPGDGRFRRFLGLGEWTEGVGCADIGIQGDSRFAIGKAATGSKSRMYWARGWCSVSTATRAKPRWPGGRLSWPTMRLEIRGLPRAHRVGLVQDDPLVIDPGPGLSFRARVVDRKSREPIPAVFVPFASAGSTGGNVSRLAAMPGVEPAANASVLAEGNESRSRQGNQNGSINDGDPSSFVVTFDRGPGEGRLVCG